MTEHEIVQESKSFAFAKFIVKKLKEKSEYTYGGLKYIEAIVTFSITPESSDGTLKQAVQRYDLSKKTLQEHIKLFHQRGINDCLIKANQPTINLSDYYADFVKQTPTKQKEHPAKKGYFDYTEHYKVLDRMSHDDAMVYIKNVYNRKQQEFLKWLYSTWDEITDGFIVSKSNPPIKNSEVIKHLTSGKTIRQLCLQTGKRPTPYIVNVRRFRNTYMKRVVSKSGRKPNPVQQIVEEIVATPDNNTFKDLLQTALQSVKGHSLTDINTFQKMYDTILASVKTHKLFSWKVQADISEVVFGESVDVGLKMLMLGLLSTTESGMYTMVITAQSKCTTIADLIKQPNEFVGIKVPTKYEHKLFNLFSMFPEIKNELLESHKLSKSLIIKGDELF